MNFNYLVINLNVVRHNVGKNVAPTSIFYLSDDELQAPHQLGPNLRDRNPQVRPYALARVEGYNEAIACGAASTRCSPHQSKPTRSQSARPDCM